MLEAIVQWIFGAALFINALLFVPQIITIIRTKSSAGVSLITFMGFWLIQLVTVIHGILAHDKILAFGFMLSMVTCSCVIICAIFYRKGAASEAIEIKNEMTQRLEMLEDIIAVMPGNVYWLNRDGVYLGCNDNQARLIGLESRKDIIGKRNIDMPGFLIADAIDNVNQQVMANGTPVVAEEPVVFENGSNGVYLSSKVPLVDKEGSVIGLLGISIDITERKNNEKALHEAKEEAEAANKMKQEFLYNMRHDIRTPFSGIVSVAQILKQSENNKDKVALLDAIEHSSTHILSYLTEILEFSQIEEGSIPLLEKPVSLRRLMEDCLAMIKPAAIKKSIQLMQTYDDLLDEQYLTDEFRLRRILINLLGNSIKFTKTGEIIVTARLKGKKSSSREVLIELEVRDTGIGIPKEKHAIIFDKFSRLAPAYEGEFSGAGLGLRAVKQLVADLDGDIMLASEEGEGATFTLQIPMKQLKSSEYLDASGVESIC